MVRVVSRTLYLMASFDSVLSLWQKLRVVSEPYARYAAALIAGLAITFTQNHSTFTGLFWLSFTVVVSLVLRDGPDTVMNKFAWWSTVVVVFMTAIGLLVGKMSTATALSLTIALVAFETSRAFTRGDRIWLWSTGVLAVGLSILYFSISADDTTAAGLTGGWAIVAGVFGLINVVDARVKASRPAAKSAPKPAARKPVASASTTTAAKKPAAKSTPTRKAATPRGPKR